MIDRLLSAAMPLPTRTQPGEAPAGTPSFLPWALSVPAQGGDGDAHLPKHNLPQPSVPQPGMPYPGMPQPDVIDDLLAVDQLALEARIEVSTEGLLATTAAAPALPSTSTATLPVPGLSTLAAGASVDALNTVQWREHMSNVVELHLRNPQGEREVVATPWRLMASGRLAQSLGAGGSVDPAAAMPILSASQALASAPVTSAQPVPANRHAVAAGLPGDALEAAFMSQPAVIRALGADDRAPLSSLPSPSPAAAEWLARWMKWIERDGRDPIVLLRDFRIDDDEARRLVDGLRAFAHAHGVELDRVVVNGREFWRRPDLSQSQE
jgi:hypothetical protein